MVRRRDAPLPGGSAGADPGADRRQPALPRGGGARARRGRAAGPRRRDVALHSGGRDRAGARHAARAAARAPGPARRRGAPGHPGGGGDRAPLRGPAAEGGLGRARRGGRGARRAGRRRVAGRVASSRAEHPATRAQTATIDSARPLPGESCLPESPRGPSYELHTRIGTVARSAVRRDAADASRSCRRWATTGPTAPRQAPGRAISGAAGDWARAVYANADAIHHYGGRSSARRSATSPRPLRRADRG